MIAIIRTFLHYFLERDLESANKVKEMPALPISASERAPTIAVASAH